MTMQEQLKVIEQKLTALGVQDLKMVLNPSLVGKNQLMEDILVALEAILDGKYIELHAIGDSNNVKR